MKPGDLTKWQYHRRSDNCIIADVIGMEYVECWSGNTDNAEAIVSKDISFILSICRCTSNNIHLNERIVCYQNKYGIFKINIDDNMGYYRNFRVIPKLI